VFLSDVHLGTVDSKAEEAADFLQRIRCRKLVLNGDIIDGWALRRGGEWRAGHTRFVRAVIEKLESEKTEVVYLRGNHDDVLERFLPFSLGGLLIAREHVHSTPRGDYLVVHGDGFDAITSRWKVVAIIGSVAYELLLRLNRVYNRWRSWRGREYFSLSKLVKSRVKSAVEHLSRFEEQLQQFARTRGCVGVICGHVHTADDKQCGDIHYLNSGDWVESLSAIVEPERGEFQVISYREFLREHGADACAEDRESDPGSPSRVRVGSTIPPLNSVGR
jgi:UDP-2,3-diacylglucosamine pyrophosphatase LpxH